MPLRSEGTCLGPGGEGEVRGDFAFGVKPPKAKALKAADCVKAHEDSIIHGRRLLRIAFGQTQGPFTGRPLPFELC